MVRRPWVLLVFLLLAVPATLADTMTTELINPLGTLVANQTCDLDNGDHTCTLENLDGTIRQACVYGTWSVRVKTDDTEEDTSKTINITFDEYYNTITGLSAAPCDFGLLQDPADSSRFLACGGGNSFAPGITTRWKVAGANINSQKNFCTKTFEVSDCSSVCPNTCSDAGYDSSSCPSSTSCLCTRRTACSVPPTACNTGDGETDAGDESCQLPGDSEEGIGIAYASSPGAFIAAPSATNWPGGNDWTATVLEPASGVSLRFLQSGLAATPNSTDILLAYRSSPGAPDTTIKAVTGMVNLSPGEEGIVTREFGCFESKLKECPGNKTLVPRLAAAIGENHSFPVAQTLYCATDGDWTPDLDGKDVESCQAAGFVATSTLCCSEADDGDEFYNDPAPPDAPARAGGCWHKQPILHGRSPNATQPGLDEAGALLPTTCPNGSIDLGVFMDLADNPTQVRGQRACSWGVNALLVRGPSQVVATEGEVVMPACLNETLNPSIPPYIIEEHGTKNFTPYTLCSATESSVKSADDAEPAACPAGQWSIGVLRDIRNASVRSYRICIKDAKLGVVKNTIDEVMNHLGRFYGCSARPAVLALTGTGGGALVDNLPACSTLAQAFPPEGGRNQHAVCRPDGIWDKTNESDPVTGAPVTMVPNFIKWDPATPFPPSKSRTGCCPANKCWNGNGCTNVGDVYVVGTRAFVCQG